MKKKNLKTLRLIGDVHGKISEYAYLVQQSSYPTLQIGDHGIGFSDKWDEAFAKLHEEYGDKARFFLGNHDDHKKARKMKGYLGRFGKIAPKVFFISGAYSIDACYRTLGKNYWSWEQLSDAEMARCKVQYHYCKPDIVIAHDCPASITKHWCKDDKWTKVPENRTGRFLESLWQSHKPSLFICGHYHQSKTIEIEGTTFKCLNELETYDLEIPDLRGILSN